MSDLEAILDTYEATSWGERQVLGSARHMLADGVDAAEVLAFLESNRELVDEWTALEEEHGIGAALKRWVEEMLEWWSVLKGDRESQREWCRRHPVFAVYSPDRHAELPRMDPR